MFGVVVLSVLRIPKSLMASPLGVDMDTHEVTFTNGTYFRQVRGAGWALCSVWCSVLCTLCSVHCVVQCALQSSVPGGIFNSSTAP